MVSKIHKKIATTHKPMSVKRCRAIRRRHRRNCSVKKSAAANSSVVLTRIGAYRGFKILQQVQPRDIRPGSRIRNPLPPLNSPEKRTVILDLDETLVHSVTGPPPKRFDFAVRPKIRGKVMTFYVAKRPGVDAFLEKLAAKYEVVVFTAGLREYATLVLDRLDRKRVVSHRLYRDSCKEVNGKFVKDLSGLGRDLRRSVIVDDNPNAYRLQPENAVPVRPFIDDRSDRELGRLLKFFEDVSNCCCDDIRVNVKKFVGGDDGYVLSDDDEEEDDDDGDRDDVVAEVSDGKTKLPVLTVFRPCPVVSVHKLNPFGMPLVLDFRTKMVILCSLFLLIVNVILCFRTEDFF